MNGYLSLFSLSLDFPPRTLLVSKTREFLVSVYESVLYDPDETYRVTMAAHELLENLVKYACGRSQVDVGLSQEGGRVYTSVETRNRASPERIDELARLFARIDSSEDAQSFYDDLIQTSDTRAGSGLGLARIRAEGKMRLTCEIHGEEVTIRALTPIHSLRPRHG